MKLRTRLTLISLLILLVPLVIWQLVHALERSLRESYQAALLDTAETAATRLSSQADAWPPGAGLYVHQAETGFEIDGRPAEWESWMELAQTLYESSGSDQSVSVIAAERRGRLHLLLDVEDSQLVFADPDSGPGDRVRLQIVGETDHEPLELAPLAPGWLERTGPGGRVRVQAALQPTDRGWRMELAVIEPERPEAVVIDVVDIDDTARRQPDTAPATGSPQPLVRRSTALAGVLDGLLRDNTGGWVIDTEGWVLAGSASPGQVEPADADGPRDGLLTNLAAALLGVLPSSRERRSANSARITGTEIDAQPGAVWYRAGRGAGFVVSAAAPVAIPGRQLGHVIIERPADRFVSAAYRALLQLFIVALVGMLVVAAATIQFGISLSHRIRSLRNAAEEAVSPDGRVRGPMRPPDGRDELAELGHGLAAMIDRQHAHQAHLKALASRLSHELRTPLAMIRSSLDNLSEVDDSEARDRYLRRAEAGCRRLQNTFDAMSQAARIEESLADEPLSSLDLGELVAHYVQGCRQTFGRHRFVATVPTQRPARIHGCGEQIAQLLDKLVENAVDFTPAGGQITLRVVPQGNSISLQVDNPGPGLPADLPADQLFDSMTTSRSGRDERAHLGLGLYIVRLIAGRHDARCRAVERPDGMRFQVDFPRDQDPL